MNKVKLKFKLNKKGINNVLNEVSNNFANTNLEINCPNCKKDVTVKASENICPNCGQVFVRNPCEHQ